MPPRASFACLLGVVMVLLEAPGTALGANTSYRDQHPLEIQALREPAEVLAMLPAAYADAERANDKRETARLALAEANACRVKADWFCQRRASERATEAAALAGDAYLGVRGLVLQARGLSSMSSFYEAERSLGKASVLLADMDAPELHADIALAYSTISSYLGKHELSVDYATRGLQQLPAGQRQPMRVRLLRNKARALVELGNLDQARETLATADSLVGDIDDPKLAAEIWLEYGRLGLDGGDADLASRMAVRISEQGGILRNSLLRGLGLELEGLAELQRGSAATAAPLLGQAAQAFQSLDQYRDEYRVVQSLAALAASTEPDPALATLLQRLDHLAHEVARRERQLASDDFEDRLLYLRQEAELTDANAKAEAARFRAEGADRSARLSIGIAVISIVALFGMGYLAVLVRRAARGLAEADQRRVQAMLRVSHDLRNPINGILGLCAALRTTPMPPESGKSVDAIASAAHSLVSLAQDLLDHGQLEARKLRLETRPTDLPSTLRHLARQYESRCADAGLAFQVELDPSLPRRASLDADRLTQVLGNLLGNALKFTPEGRITLVAKVVRRVEHIHVITFEVHDTGPGIAEAERERLMLPFEKGSSGKLHASGAGLGLAISSNLVALMGGRLQLNSKPGAGAIFHFTLSLEALPDVPSYRGVSHSLTAAASSRQVQRVLVVDDDALNREYHGLLLSAQSFEPTLAADAEQAVEHARSVDFDAALIDLDMTGASGAELAVRLRDAARSKRRPIRLVMVSGYPPSRELGSETVDAWLLKPLTPAALRDALRADAA